MPRDTPKTIVAECMAFGARVYLVEGLISDCGKLVAQGKERFDWFDLSTLKEPYRLEGKKIMGYELFLDFEESLPDVIIYPTGGGTGLIGMWKAFGEMERLGWIKAGADRPRMYSVQAEGCAPLVRAFEAGAEYMDYWEDAHTVAAGLRVPGAVGDFLMLRALRESGGGAVAVSDEELMGDQNELAAHLGIYPCPEGGATWSALKKLVAQGLIEPDERIVLFNTGSGLKYTDLISTERLPVLRGDGEDMEEAVARDAKG